MEKVVKLEWIDETRVKALVEVVSIEERETDINKIRDNYNLALNKKVELDNQIEELEEMKENLIEETRPVKEFLKMLEDETLEDSESIE